MKITSFTGHKEIRVSIQLTEEEIEVGRLILDNRLVYFKYDDDFLQLGWNLSPIKLRFDNSIQIADPDPFHGIFGVFDDSLPDGWGMLLLNRALEKQGLSINDITILDQLAFVGTTGKGALIYRPAFEHDSKPTCPLDLDQLKTEMDDVYNGFSSDVIDELLVLGGSSGGARPKANVGYNPLTDELIHGLNNLPDGFEHWIIKFPNSEDPLDIANIEFAYYKMALLAGIEMSDSKLLTSSKGQEVFATKRFDRIGSQRLHMHSMAGLTHDNFRRSSIDYGHIIDTAYVLERSAEARKKAFRLATFNVYSHNRDDHSKNVSWLMDQSGKWYLAPAYDLTYSSTAIGEHSTRVDGEGANPSKKQLLSLAKEFSISGALDIIDQVQNAIAQWPSIATSCNVSSLSMNRIQQRLESIRDRDK